MNKKKKPAYEVHHHDNPFRFRVLSASRPDVEHVVDVSANGGIGECSCEHFTYRLYPAIVEGLVEGDAGRCGHIVAARDTCLDSLIARIAQEEKNEH